ncbi:DUF2891 domain-containing protein [Sphingomonas sp. IW22]|uniref:DUF2891 domain-containing protein n=1 Tax=Sphingomonas sp. IW22 TaxID=3242489 RepID=UPI0035221CDA
MSSHSELTPELASSFARLTLDHLGREWPYKLDQVLNGPEDVRTPAALHPIFHGSFDWHSCVHGWWQVLRLLRWFPDLPEAPQIRARADRMLTAEKVAGELAYLNRPNSGGFERPYGWGWLLALHNEASRHDGPWGAALEPLALAFAARFHGFLPKLTYPIRVGTHFNSAFALSLSRDWACGRDESLVALIDERARAWFGGDAASQAWEPGGDEFLSSALTEALLMSRVEPDFAAWFDRFLPDAAAGQPASIFTPAHVSDRSDGKIAHLDGLNLSRAWCWRAIADRLGREHPVFAPAQDAALRHLTASMDHLADNYMGAHWLASFALLALGGETR